MNSSFLSIVFRALRTLSASSADPRCSTQFENSIMAASSASWFPLILKSREGIRSEFGIAGILLFVFSVAAGFFEQGRSVFVVHRIGLQIRAFTEGIGDHWGLHCSMCAS